MALRAGALASPAVGISQEASRGRQSLALSRCSLVSPVKKSFSKRSAGVLDCRRKSSQLASKKISSPAAPLYTAVDRLSVTCGTGIAQPGEVRMLHSIHLHPQSAVGGDMVPLKLPCCPYLLTSILPCDACDSSRSLTFNQSRS